jgi:hypothetical protein
MLKNKCPEGKEIGSKGKCVVSCKKNQERNPVTGRCKKTVKAVKAVKAVKVASVKNATSTVVKTASVVKSTSENRHLEKKIADLELQLKNAKPIELKLSVNKQLEKELKRKITLLESENKKNESSLASDMTLMKEMNQTIIDLRKNQAILEKKLDQGQDQYAKLTRILVQCQAKK